MKNVIKSKAFTLIEVLVAVVITGMVLSSVLLGYWQMVKVNHTINLSRQLQKEVHFAMVRMADKIRDYSIDYNAYTNPTGSCGEQTITSPSKLCIGNSNNNYIFEKNTENQLLMNETPLLSDKFKIDILSFFITPNLDPFNSDNLCEITAQLQPKVTILMKAEAKHSPDVNINLQTTISSRVYQ